MKSLNPSDKQIRVMMVEERLRRTRQPLEIAFPDSEKLTDFLNKPVDKRKYYNMANKRVQYIC